MKAWASLLLLLYVACGHRETPAAARYLDGAEIQAETNEQRAAIGKALDDMLALPPNLLKNARYGPDQKTLPALLRAHLVPSQPVAVEDDEFYANGADPRLRAAVEKLRDKLKRGN